MRRSTALAAAVVALLLAASAVLASDGPVLSFSATAQQVTVDRAQQLALQLARSAARRRPGVDRPVLVPKHRPPSPTALPTASAPTPPTPPAPAAKPAPAPRAAAPLRQPVAPKPARRARPAAADPVRTESAPESSASSAAKLPLPPMNPGVSRELIKDAKQALERTRPPGEGAAPR